MGLFIGRTYRKKAEYFICTAPEQALKKIYQQAVIIRMCRFSYEKVAVESVNLVLENIWVISQEV